uniref:Uncharacterized protein n=1 Tax=viral metagenome TaxID=1070528 RepID=A0A6C0KYM2_9ZZZZ
MSFSLSDWQAIAEHHRQQLTSGTLNAYHRAQIAYAEKQFASLSGAVHMADLHQRALALADTLPSKRKKALFKWLVEKHDAVENVCNILEDVRPYLMTLGSAGAEDNVNAAFTPAFIQAQCGMPNSDQWRDFQLRVIKQLLDDGSFGLHASHALCDFEDTASGCDETVQEAAFAVLESSLPHN